MEASWPIPSDLKVVSVNDYPLTYAERGSGTPVILVHGSVTDYRAWTGVMDPLGERYHVIAPNLRYYYPEPWKGEGGNFSAEQHADDLAALAKVLNLGKAHWVGWSRGGLVMVEVAKRHRDVVRSLIFEDGGIDIPVEETDESGEAVAFSRALLGPCAITSGRATLSGSGGVLRYVEPERTLVTASSCRATDDFGEYLHRVS